jgi:transposase
MLKPIKEKEKVFLLCPKCGNKTELKKKDDYTIIQKIEHKPSEKLEVTELQRRRKLSEEEREELEDAYGDMLEQMQMD